MISKERENLIDDRLFSLYETVYITEMKSVLYNILFYNLFTTQLITFAYMQLLFSTQLPLRRNNESAAMLI